MPGKNRMGPTGQGPQTGRRAGYCGGNQSRDIETAGRRGVGGGKGRRSGGRGRHGHRNMFYATGLTGRQRTEAEAQTIPEAMPSKTSETKQPAELDELETLKQQAADLTSSLQQIQDRLAALEAPTDESN